MTTSALLEGSLVRRLERVSLATRRKFSGEGQGDRRSLRRGSSLEFADYRHYVPGDDPNRVDWHIYGRTNALFVRVYEEEDLLNVTLMLDASRSMDWGEPNKLQYGRRLAAALGYVALNASNRLFVHPLGATASTFGPAWGRPQANSLLRYLETVTPAQTQTPDFEVHGHTPSIGDYIGSYRSRTIGLTIFISDLLTPAWESALTSLARKPGEVVVLHTLAPEELRPELGGDARLIDRETGKAVSVTLNSDALRIYGERLTEWRREVETFCVRHGFTYVPVDTGAAFEHLVFDTFRRRGVLR